MIKKLTNNFEWKILSILFAFILWIVVQNIADPIITREKEIVVTKVNKESEEFNKGKMINIIEGDKITVRCKGKRSILDKLSKTDINAKAVINLDANNKTVPIEVTSNLNSIEIVRWWPDTMTINVEDIKKTSIEIEPIIKGKLKYPYVQGDIEIKPERIQISAPESIINKINKVVLEIPLDSNIKKDIVSFGTPKILDSKDDIITNVNLDDTTIDYKVTVNKEKKIKLRQDVVGKPKKGYKISNINYPQELTIIGPEKDIVRINNKILPQIDVTGLKESKVYTIDVTKYFEDIIVKDAKIITVKVDIEPTEDKTFTVPLKMIEIKNLPKNLNMKYITQEDINIKVNGLKRDIEKINLDNLRCRIDLEKFESGQHTVPVRVNLPLDVELVQEQYITLLLN